MRKKRPLLKAIIILIIVVGFIWIIKDPIFSHFISKKMGSGFSMSRMGVYPSHMTIDHLRIKNPPGFRLSTAFSSKDVRIEYSYDQITSSPAYIDYMEFDDAFLSIECTNSDCSENNWKQIAHAKSTHAKGYTIDKVVFRDLTVEVLKDGSVKKEKTIPLLEFNQISSEDGFPIQALIKQIFESADLKQYNQGFPDIPGQGRRAGRRTIRRHDYYKDNE